MVYEDLEKIYQNQLISCQLDLRKLKQTKNIIIQQYILEGMTPEQAQQSFSEEWNLNKEACKAIQYMLGINREKLDKAKHELYK